MIQSSLEEILRVQLGNLDKDAAFEAMTRKRNIDRLAGS